MRIMAAIAAALLLAPMPAAAEERPDLATLFAPLIGQCWTGAFPGGAARDTHCFRLVEGGRYVEDRHVVTGSAKPYGGVTYYRYDAEQGAIRFHYFANDGGYSEGRAVPVAGGFDFPAEDYVGAAGQRMAIRNRLRFDPAGGYAAESEAREGEGWKPLFAMRFDAAGSAPPAGVLAFDRLRVSRAAVGAAEAGADAAARAVLADAGDTPDRLLSARCTCASRVEPAGTGGGTLRLILSDLTAPLATGGSVPLVLVFERAGAAGSDFHIAAGGAEGWDE